MAEAFYAFRDSTASQARSDILSSMHAIRGTLSEIQSATDRLRPEWTAVEADSYYDIISQWHKGATGVNDILNDVEKALGSMQDGNAKLRQSIAQVLDETS